MNKMWALLAGQACFFLLVINMSEAKSAAYSCEN